MKFDKAKQKAKLTNLWKQIIQKRDKKCVACGSRDYLQSHHICYKGAFGNACKWELENGVALCRACHYKQHNGYHNEIEAETEPYLYKTTGWTILTLKNFYRQCYFKDTKANLLLKEKVLRKELDEI